jgi:hypothetical protein
MHYFIRDTWTRKKDVRGLLIEEMIILKRILKYVCCDDLNAICHVEDRETLRALVSTAMNVAFPFKSGRLLKNRATSSELVFCEKLVSISTERVWCTVVRCLPRTGKVFSPNFKKWPNVVTRIF